MFSGFINDKILVALEKNYDIKFKAVFEAIHELMTPLQPKKKALS